MAVLAKDGAKQGAARPRQRQKKVTFEELSAHGSAESLWIAIDSKVYDLTSWQSLHPGGQLPLLAVAGGDASDVFAAMHPPNVRNQLQKFFVGELDTTSPPPLPLPDASGRPSPFLTEQERALISDYRDLRRDIQDRGLMCFDPIYYVQKGLVLAVALGMIVSGVVFSDSTAVHLLCASALGLWWNQVNFIGHDAGHNSITGNIKIDSAIGYFVGNVLTGVSIGWWKRSHNVHHIACNSITHDPDLQHIPVFAVSKDFFQSHFSFYHFRRMTFDALAQFLVSHQHLTFYPIMAIARLNLYIQSLLLLFSKHRLDHRGLEACSMFAFWMWYSALLLQLPSLWEIVAFFFISHAMTGILHVQICISHFASPTYEGRNTAALWPKTQLFGTMDVDCPPCMDWFHGGLQFQIEHHLFPRVPRRNLRAIAPAVKTFCKKHNIPYTIFSFWDANLEVLAVLQRSAIHAKQFRAKGKSLSGNQADPSDSFFQSLLWDALNARG